MTQLCDLKCVPCRGDVPPLKGKEIEQRHAQLEGWAVIDEQRLSKKFKFPNFAKALEFVNTVGDLAEEQGHHPDICLGWGRVQIELHTHMIDGLSENDFILAAKIDKL